jgi:TRAP-type uncharacterized transport system substrate-binding protein
MQIHLRSGASRRARAALIKSCMTAVALALPPTAHAVAASSDDAQSRAAKTHTRPGMVRYEKPVYHNGVRVLWHGAWRDDRGRAAAVSPARGAALSAKEPEITIIADGSDATALREVTEFASVMQHAGLNVKAIAARTSPAGIDKAVAAGAADLAVAAMDALADAGKGTPADRANWRARAPYLARLANETIALVAPREITDVKQLAGRKVSIGAADSAAAASAGIIFSKLNIAPTISNDALTDALPRLARGEIDAVFIVGADDSQALADFGKDGRFHIVAIPYAPALQALYCPMRLTAHEEPNLIGANDKVDTIGVPTALLAIDAAPNSPHAAKIATVAEHFFGQFDQNFGVLPASKWKEVNLAARIPGWPRFGAAEAWLEQNAGASNGALDAFRGAAETAASANGVPGESDSDKLYDSLMKLSGAAQ